MVLPDVNVLVYAYRADSPHHQQTKEWLEDLVFSDEAYGLAELVCSSFLRIVTHPSIYSPPSLIEDALAFVEFLRAQPNCVPVSPGGRHWRIFASLCASGGIRGNLVPDAYLAALAIESGSEWITIDGDYARFPGLRWRRPFAAA